ncbi:MAG: hypothetical protein H6510_15995 [Acidobacteria bacterium]|nr:hypothetical protein [Acidobacteriota bacterium]MCB9399315.1 hypothetical protein [Acidobacteriota bacterium]
MTEQEPETTEPSEKGDASEKKEASGKPHGYRPKTWFTEGTGAPQKGQRSMSSPAKKARKTKSKMAKKSRMTNKKK